jgi:HlyD family secretion protein
MRKCDRSNSFTALAAVAGFSLSLSGCGQAEPAAQAGKEAATKAAADNTPTVRLVTAERTTIRRTTTQPATIHAYHQAEIHAKVSGYLSELKVDIGETVDEGDVLGVVAMPEMQISYERQETEIRRFQAEEQSAAAGVKLALANVNAAEAQQAQAVAEVEQMDAQLNADASEFKRVSNLVEQKAVAARLLDEALQKSEASTSAKAAAQAAMKSAVASVSVALAKAAVAQAGVAAAAAQTDVSRKELEELEAMMQYAVLKAPFRGVVTRRHVDPGDLVRNIQTAPESTREPLFEIAQVDRVRVRIAIPEPEAPLTRVGNAVSLKLRSLPDREFPGTISRLARRLDESTRTMLVEVDLPNTDGLLIPGMYAEATVTLQETPDALVVAATAIRFDNIGNSSVYVIENGAVRIVPVTTGHDDGRQIQILSGIDETAKIAAGRIGRFKDGQRVRVDGN